METRGSVRRAANQQRAAEHFTQEWLRRQGPGAAVALERIQNLTRNGEHGDVIIDPGPVARATPATFAETSPTLKRTASHGIPIPYQPPSWKNASTCAVNLPRKRVRTVVPDLRGLDESLPKHQLVSTRAQTKKLTTDEKAEIFERILVPVVASGYLMWYQFLRVGGVSRACRALWIHRRETYGPWKKVLKELNGINGTNKCSRCEQEVTLRLYRTFCDSDLWNEECRKRTPDFVSCVDILMSSGFLTWRECGGIRRICKETYKMYKGQCTCRRNIVDRTPNRPFLKIDPRFQADYNLWTDYEKCEALIRYTHFSGTKLAFVLQLRKSDQQQKIAVWLGRMGLNRYTGNQLANPVSSSLCVCYESGITKYRTRGIASMSPCLVRKCLFRLSTQAIRGTVCRLHFIRTHRPMSPTY